MNTPTIDNTKDIAVKNKFKTKTAQFFVMGAASFALASFSTTAIIPVAIAGGVIGGLMLAEVGYKAYKNNNEKNKTAVESLITLSNPAPTEKVADSIKFIRDKMHANSSSNIKLKN